MKKGELKKQLKISTTKFNRVYNPDIVERIIGISYSDFKKMRILPAFVLDRMLLYWNVGDTYVPDEGIYLLENDNSKWAINDIDTEKRTVTLVEIDKYGMLSDRSIKGLSFDVIRIAYKRL
ncbi:hypothetical protein EBZ38_05480 [bacterium]|nr:hypothetical protein [bacterium]